MPVPEIAAQPQKTAQQPLKQVIFYLCVTVIKAHQLHAFKKIWWKSK
jgi:hypothetical protein